MRNRRVTSRSRRAEQGESLIHSIGKGDGRARVRDVASRAATFALGSRVEILVEPLLPSLGGVRPSEP